MKDEIDMDLLGQKAPRWNASTSLPRKIDKTVGDPIEDLAVKQQQLMMKKGLGLPMS